MFWADKLLENLKGQQVINDSWTPSGMVHMGGPKGPVLHDVLFKILKERKTDVSYIFGFDDADPIDGLPKDLMESHSKYMGVPLSMAPSPDGQGSFGDYFGNIMRKLFKELNVEAEIYKTSELYKNGTFNKAISFVLDHTSEIRKVYEEIYKKELREDWFPLQVICPKCEKLGTTKVTSWDGKEVAFSCEPDLVKWAYGCGTKGKISPFDGVGKMSYKVEWPSKWWIFGVTIEGAGKDHMSAGGTHDVAAKIYKDVFKKETPFSFLYEHFLSHGKKMSSSKGIGVNAQELLNVLPPQIYRFLLIKTPPNQAIEFTPKDTDIVLKLYDDYQKAEGTRAFELSQIREIKKPPTIRFSVLAQWVQMPNMEETIKKEGLTDWAKYARIWIEKYAPESEKFLVQKEMPEEARNLSDLQKQFLQKIASELDEQWNAEDFQKELYEIAKNLNLSSKDAFAAIYLSLIGKNHGPKAAWLILSLDEDFVKNRFTAVIPAQAGIQNNNEVDSHFHGNDKGKYICPDIFSISPELKSKFPSVSVGVAIIKEVNIKKTNEDLEKEKNELIRLLEGLTTEQLGQYPEILSYRKLYKETGIDWHSHRPSPEALLRRVALKKGLYNINTCVDAYNLVVMKHRVSVGAFDADKIKFPTMLRTAKSSESILLLGDEEQTQYKDGEIAYFDQIGGFNIDFNYRDAQRTAVQMETKNIYVNVDGVYNITPQKVEQVLKEAVNTIIRYCGGKIEAFGVEIAS